MSIRWVWDASHLYARLEEWGWKGEIRLDRASWHVKRLNFFLLYYLYAFGFLIIQIWRSIISNLYFSKIKVDSDQIPLFLRRDHIYEIIIMRDTLIIDSSCFILPFQIGFWNYLLNLFVKDTYLAHQRWDTH